MKCSISLINCSRIESRSLTSSWLIVAGELSSSMTIASGTFFPIQARWNELKVGWDQILYYILSTTNIQINLELFCFLGQLKSYIINNKVRELSIFNLNCTFLGQNTLHNTLKTHCVREHKLERERVFNSTLDRYINWLVHTTIT